MTNVTRISWLAGLGAAVAMAGALPVYAETDSLIAEAATETAVEAPFSEATVEINFESPVSESPVSETSVVETAELVPTELVPAETATSADLLVETPTEATFQLSEGNLLAFDQAGIQAALGPSEAEAEAAVTEGIELAQTTRRPYGSVSPAYLGVGGNLGFGDPDSAIGDFGFNVISKISLGPRFSLRPGFFISERFTNFAVPLTYNFNTMSVRGFRFQPYVGAGVDVPFNGNTALMVNAGADVPISRDFTLNTAANFRVTSGFGFGLSLGVGYNFPFIFE